MASTSAFGWETPDDTDLVKDGAAAIRTLGNSIDTSMSELKGGTTGQVLSKTSNTDMDFTWVAQDDSNAIQNAIVDAKGDLIAASANDTPARLAVGNNGETLVADSSTATGLKWAAPSSGSMTLLSTTSLSGATTTITGISQSYTHLMIRIYNTDMSSNATINVGVVDTSSNTYTLIGAMPNTQAATGIVGYSTSPLLEKTVRASGTNNINAVIQLPFYSSSWGSGNGTPLWSSIGQVYDSAGASWQFMGAGITGNTSNVTDGIYFGLSTGTWSAGTVKIYGVK